MQSLALRLEGSLSLKDEVARELVKDTFHLVGHQIPEQTLVERMRARQTMLVDSEEFIALDDLSEYDDEPLANLADRVHLVSS